MNTNITRAVEEDDATKAGRDVINTQKIEKKDQMLNDKSETHINRDTCNEDDSTWKEHLQEYICAHEELIRSASTAYVKKNFPKIYSELARLLLQELEQIILTRDRVPRGSDHDRERKAYQLYEHRVQWMIKGVHKILAKYLADIEQQKNIRCLLRQSTLNE